MRTTHTPPARHGLPRSVVFSRALTCLLVVALGTLAVGCRSNTRYDGIEAELRTRERELADTRAHLDQARNLLRAYEAAQQPPPGGTYPGGPYLPIKDIAIGRGTGGVDEDAAVGDEGLLVVIVPRDEDGAAVKVPAKAMIAAWEILPTGVKNHIGTWEIPPDKLRRTWKAGVISTGYSVAVPWQQPPSTDRLRVAARLITADGRTYEADRDVSVRPPLPMRGSGATGPVPIPGAPPGRTPVYPEMAPPGVPPKVPLPPGVEELPPPLPSDRGARLLPPQKQ